MSILGNSCKECECVWGEKRDGEVKEWQLTESVRQAAVQCGLQSHLTPKTKAVGKRGQPLCEMFVSKDFKCLKAAIWNRKGKNYIRLDWYGPCIWHQMLNFNTSSQLFTERISGSNLEFSTHQIIFLTKLTGVQHFVHFAENSGIQAQLFLFICVSASSRYITVLVVKWKKKVGGNFYMQKCPNTMKQ